MYVYVFYRFSTPVPVISKQDAEKLKLREARFGKSAKVVSRAERFSAAT